MPNIDKVIEALWDKREASIYGADGKEYRVIFSRPGGFFDVSILDNLEPMGFITLKHENKGLYSIVNDTKINPHSSLANTPGHGIEVKEKFRKRGAGKALLSVGIGIIQRDWRLEQRGGEFKVIASDITNIGLGCYHNFGFTIKEGMAVSSCYYTDPDTVPEINILPKKVCFIKRLAKRLRRDLRGDSG
ncbi:MAG: GNAT family N-acetyltransferase [Desulfobacterales bacterium]|nr:GNAT family N-acetyltransferase [Desulfobacterales bacterium]